MQVPYLIYKWNISQKERDSYRQLGEKEKDVFLLEVLMKHQSTTFTKYIKSLRFILQIVSSLKDEQDKSIYYSHISCLIGKEELGFLKCFSEFNMITK